MAHSALAQRIFYSTVVNVVVGINFKLHKNKQLNFTFIRFDLLQM